MDCLSFCRKNTLFRVIIYNDLEFMLELATIDKYGLHIYVFTVKIRVSEYSLALDEHLPGYVIA
jgi:hypothetical protein